MYAVLTTKKARWPRRLLAAREPTPKKNAEEDANGRSCRPQRRTLQEPARRRDRVSCCGLRATPAIALLDVSLECGASRRQRERPAKRTAHLGPTSLRLCGIICQTTIAKYLAKTEEKLTVLAQSGRLPPAPAHTHHHHQPHTHTPRNAEETLTHHHHHDDHHRHHHARSCQMQRPSVKGPVRGRAPPFLCSLSLNIQRYKQLENLQCRASARQRKRHAKQKHESAR